jgi:molecular chaperone GrpE
VSGGGGGGDGAKKDLELSAGAATEDAPAEPALENGGAEGASEGSEAAAIASTEEENAALRREVAELRDALLRRRADFDNFKKRVERDRGVVAAEAEAALLKQLLGTLDNLERALASQDAASGLREGVALTHREFVSLLESLGVETLDPLGQRFDPSEAQAILHEPAPGFAEGTVAEVFRKGFRYRERLLRPALVKVASAAALPGKDEGGDVQ